LRAQSRKANLVGRREHVELMRRTRRLDQASHPAPAVRRVALKIQHNRHTSSEQLHHMRARNLPDPARAPQEVLAGGQLARVKRAQPLILGDQHRLILQRQLGRER
jgi:hypothetical protein